MIALIVEDDVLIAMDLKFQLRDIGMEAVLAHSMDDAITEAARTPF